jgi:serine/threonine protein kinase
LPANEARLVAQRYQLARELGRGGMGVVWLAEDQLVGRQVAVKELRAPQTLAARDRETFSQRALAEARSAARIHHPGAVVLYDVLPASAGDDAIYLIMELVEGPTLAQLTQRGPLPAAHVAAFGLQLLSVLQAAHALGVVHRDIKPANIIIAAGGQAKLTDFGIAHTVGDPRLTRSGIMGTQGYLAPELFEAAPITPAADIWSLGATLFAAAEGRGPFDRDSTGATLRALLIDAVRAPRCPPLLAAAITGMLQRDPARRATLGQARDSLLHAAAQPMAPWAPPATPVPQASPASAAPQAPGMQAPGVPAPWPATSATGTQTGGGADAKPGQYWNQFAATTRSPQQPLAARPTGLATMRIFIANEKYRAVVIIGAIAFMAVIILIGLVAYHG